MTEMLTDEYSFRIRLIVAIRMVEVSKNTFRLCFDPSSPKYGGLPLGELIVQAWMWFQICI